MSDDVAVGEDITSHARNHFTSSRKRHSEIQCNTCKLEFSSSKNFKQHKKEHEPKPDESKYKYTYNKTDGTYSCNTCDNESKSEKDMAKHVQSHEDTYNCNMCSLKYQTAYKCAVHMRIHSKEGNFMCPLCDYQTNKRPGMRQHINTTHLHKFVYNCSHCGKGFDDVIKFKEHEYVHTGKRPFSCIVCSKEFPFSSYLLTHQRRIHRVTIAGVLLPNQCHVCKKIFTKADTFANHVVKHQSNLPREKKHLCDTCGKGFATMDKLKTHNRVHTGIKPYLCKYCSKSFTKLDYLIMHERIHSGEKPYSCRYCGKRFNQGAPLRIHIRIHTGERPYICHLCNRGFISKGALTVHLKRCTG